jgi:hypothetical protein
VISYFSITLLKRRRMYTSFRSAGPDSASGGILAETCGSPPSPFPAVGSFSQSPPDDP